MQSTEVTQKAVGSFPRRSGLRKLGMIGLGLLAAAVVVRLTTTDVVARWKAERMSNTELGHAAGLPGASYSAVFEWAKRLEEAGRAAEANRVYARAATVNPARADAWIGMGRTYFITGEWGRSEQALRQVLKQWPDEAEAHFILAGVLANTLREKEAASHLKAGLRLEPGRREPLLSLGQIELKQGDAPGAADAFARAKAAGPDLPALHAPYGQALLEANRIPDAIKELEAALKVDPSNLPARLNLGKALVLSGKSDDRTRGMKEISRVAEFSSNKAPAFIEAARIWLGEKNRSDAEQALEHAVDADASNVDALRLLVQTYREGPRPEIARKFEERLRALEDAASQREALRREIESGRDVIANLVKLGDLSLSAGDRLEAFTAFSAAKGLDPENSGAEKGLRRVAAAAKKAK